MTDEKLTETVEQARDRLMPQVLAYAQMEGLSEVGIASAALRIGITDARAVFEKAHAPTDDERDEQRECCRVGCGRTGENNVSNWNDSIEQDELATKLREVVIGRKLVSAEGDVITLDNGTKITIEGSSDCCAWGSATVGKVIDSEHVITGVASESLGAEEEYGPERARVFLMTDAGSAMRISQEWDASNGYYFYGLYLNVAEVQS